MNETINILNVENGSYHSVYDNISREVDEIFEKINESFVEDKVNVFKNILMGSSIKCIETINTYFIVFFTIYNMWFSTYMRNYTIILFCITF